MTTEYIALVVGAIALLWAVVGGMRAHRAQSNLTRAINIMRSNML